MLREGPVEPKATHKLIVMWQNLWQMLLRKDYQRASFVYPSSRLKVIQINATFLIAAEQELEATGLRNFYLHSALCQP